MNKSNSADMENIRKRASFMDAYARLWMSAWLFAMDILSILTGFLIAIQIRGLYGLSENSHYKELLVLLVIILSALFYRKGLYPAVGFHYVDELRHIVSSTMLAHLIVITITFLLKTSLVYSRFILILAGAISTGLIPLSRYLIRRLMIHWKLWGEPALIIGDVQKGQPLFDYFLVNLQVGIRPIAILSSEPQAALNNEFLSQTQPLSRIRLLTRQLSIMTVLVLMDDIGDAHLLAEKYRLLFRRVILIKDQSDNFALTNLQTLDFLNVIGLEVKNDLLSRSSQIAKRTLDIFGSIFGLLFFAPLMGLAAALIKLDSPGPVIYRQQRVGKNGIVFQLLKFRTMHKNADQIFKHALEKNVQLRDEWLKYQKLKNDPRITRIGGFLRKFSIDELPQLWNVLIGSMSLVGPRPFMVDQSELYGEYMNRYILVLPGMTGLWQVSGRSETTFARRASLDREYIERWTLWLDIYIILKTIKIVLLEKNAY